MTKIFFFKKIKANKAWKLKKCTIYYTTQNSLLNIEISCCRTEETLFWGEFWFYVGKAY